MADRERRRRVPFDRGGPGPLIIRTAVAGWGLVMASAVMAATVPVQYNITTHGTGPGVEMVSRTATSQTISKGECHTCSGGCVFIPGIPDIGITDLLQVPVGDTNLSFQVSAGGPYVQTGGWSWDTHPCQGVNTGGGPESGGNIRVPVSCFQFRIGAKVETKPNQFCQCIRQPNGQCALGCDEVGVSSCAPSGSMSLAVTYKRASANAPKSCQQSGTEFVEADGLWHPVASATCMTVPDTATVWAGSAQLTGTGTGSKIESVMTRIDIDPNTSPTPYPAGPKLWVRVEPGCSTCQRPVTRLAQGNPEWTCYKLDCLKQYSFLNCPAPGCPQSDLFCPGRSGCGTPTIGAKGCAMTCLAMISGHDPRETNRKATLAGAVDTVDGSLTNWWDSGLAVGRKLIHWVDFAEDEDVRSALCKGFVIASVDHKKYQGKPFDPTLSKHFVVVEGEVPGTGEKKCRFKIADPAGASAPAHEYLDEYVLLSLAVFK